MPVSRGAAVAVGLALLVPACGGDGPDAGLTAAGPSTVAVSTTLPATTSPPPPLGPGVRELMTGAGMTPLGERIFVSARPELQDRATLETDCGVPPSVEPGSTHTFGCLVRGRIHVRSFAAPEMRDLSFVVAAHELLHAAYLQLPAAERASLDAELAAARAGNEPLEERLRVYVRLAEDTPSEVYALLGTEFSDLPPTLEAHYARYFDRARVLAAFRRTVGDREEELRRLEANIASLGARLDAASADLAAHNAAGDVAGYNAQVSTYNSLVRQHNDAVARFNQRLDEYRALLAN